MEKNKRKGQTGKLNLTYDYLQETLDYSAKSLVGKVLKRHEVISDPSSLKSAVKELIYEHYRNLRDILFSYNKGLEMSIYDFKSKGEKDE